MLDVHGSFQLLNSSHVRERGKALLRSIMVGGDRNGFLLGRVVARLFHVGFVGRQMVTVFNFGSVPFLLLLRFMKILNFMIS